MLYIENNESILKDIKVPQIFIRNEPIRKVLFQVIANFSAEEQAVIYLYYCWDISINEIVKATGFKQSFISCLIFLFTERMNAKLELFKKIPNCNIEDSISLNEMLKIEMDEYMTKLMSYQNDEAIYKYFKGKQKEIFEKIIDRVHR